MSNLKVVNTDLAFENDIMGDFKVCPITGDAFISQVKTSELTGIPRTTIQDWIKKDPAGYNTNENSQLDAKSLQKAVLSGMLKGYELCTPLSEKLMEAGAKAFIYQEAGYQFNAQPKPLTPAEILLQQAQFMVEQEKVNHKVSNRLNAIEERQDKMNGDTQYLTALAFCRLNKIPAPLKAANALGRKASKACKQQGFPVGKVPDERWGQVNSYPREVLETLI